MKKQSLYPFIMILICLYAQILSANENQHPDPQTHFTPNSVKKQITQEYWKRITTHQPPSQKSTANTPREGETHEEVRSTVQNFVIIPPLLWAWYRRLYHQFTDTMNPWGELPNTEETIENQVPTTPPETIPHQTDPSHPLGYDARHPHYFPPADTDGFGQQPASPEDTDSSLYGNFNQHPFALRLILAISLIAGKRQSYWGPGSFRCFR